MKIINPSFEFVNEIDSEAILNKIEKAYRICYLSEPKGNRDEFIRTKIAAEHESPLEHTSISVIITTNRGVTHEIVRHRLGSYCQESTRFCNYSKDKFGNEITFTRPAWVSEKTLGQWDFGAVAALEGNIPKNDSAWLNSCLLTESEYLTLIKEGWQPQQAREVLNNSVATKIMVTYNIREWRHFFKLRAIGTTGSPHPNMLQVTLPMLEEFKKKIPIVFDDLEIIK